MPRQTVSEAGASSLANDYLQISSNLYAALPKSRPPVGLYSFEPSLGRLEVVADKEVFIPRLRRGALNEMCDDGNLFLHLKEYKDFVAAVAKNADIVLTEDTLEDTFAADVLVAALSDKLLAFLNQPVAPMLAELTNVCAVFCEYVWAYPDKTRAFASRLADDDTDTGHGVRVGILAALIHASLVQEDVLALLSPFTGYLCHDIGLSPIPSESYRHKRPLTAKQKLSVTQHPRNGINILRRLEGNADLEIDLAAARSIILSHHERLDGSGYPDRLRKVPVPAQICGLADAYVAMISTRRYRPAFSREEALETLAATPGYNPALVKALGAFLANADQA